MYDSPQYKIRTQNERAKKDFPFIPLLMSNNKNKDREKRVYKTIINKFGVNDRKTLNYVLF